MVPRPNRAGGLSTILDKTHRAMKEPHMHIESARYVAAFGASLVLTMALSSCGSATSTAADNAAELAPQATQREETQRDSAITESTADFTSQRQDEMKTCQKFIDAYDQRPGTDPIEPSTAFDPQAEGSEFAKDGDLGTDLFTGSYGAHWTSGGMVGDIISFKSAEGTYGIVVYAYGPQSEVSGFYRDAVTVLFSEVDQNNLSAAILDASTGGGTGKVDGCDLPVMTYQVSGDNAVAAVGSSDFSQTDVQESDPNAEIYAIQAVREYGEKAYPYGFKLHTVAGVESAVPVGPDCWTFGIKCDVTNEFGATAKDQTCIAMVKKVDGTWQVTEFSIE